LILCDFLVLMLACASFYLLPGTVLLTSKYSVFYFQVQCFLLSGTVFFTSRYSTSYFQVQCFLLSGTVFFTSRYSTSYFQVQYFFNFSPIPYSDRHLYSPTLEVLRILQPSKRVHFGLQEYRIPEPYNKQSMVLCPLLP